MEGGRGREKRCLVALLFAEKSKKVARLYWYGMDPPPTLSGTAPAELRDEFHS